MSMKETISWSAKYVLFPLIPFVIGTLVRYFYQGSLSLSIFDPAELSFSMSIISLLVIIGANKLNDKHLADSLLYLYVLSLFLFLAAFVCASSSEMELKGLINLSIENYKNTPQYGSNITSATFQTHYSNQIEAVNSRISLIRIFTIYLSCIVIPLTIMCKSKFKLES